MRWWRKQIQIVWWGWREAWEWGWCKYDGDPWPNAQHPIYRWRLAIGPFEVRRWETILTVKQSIMDAKRD